MSDVTEKLARRARRLTVALIAVALPAALLAGCAPPPPPPPPPQPVMAPAPPPPPPAPVPMVRG